jgi:AraC-like DNA-binding protein
VHTLGIRFRPGAVTSRLPFDMAPTTDREVPLSELIGRPDADDFETKLARAHRHGRALSFAERWLTNRPARARRRTDDVTRPIVRAILRTRGRRRIDELAADLGIHRRRLERAFARDLGVRPKLFARIVRLNAAIATLDRMDGSRAVDWALEAGYFDQAHLARDFRTVAGRSPRQPRGAGDEMARHFTASGRLSAYLAGE